MGSEGIEHFDSCRSHVARKLRFVLQLVIVLAVQDCQRDVLE